MERPLPEELWLLLVVINYGKIINNEAEMAQNGRGLLFFWNARAGAWAWAPMWVVGALIALSN